MFAYLFGGVILYNIIDNYKQRLYFYPIKQQYNTKYRILQKQNHFAITNVYSNKLKSKCLLISHGNSGNITLKDNLFDQLINYNGDIYCYEYCGFGNCDGVANINTCINEHKFWLNELNNYYDEIELWSESIDGGIIIETLCSIDDNIILNKIKKIYLHSTFNKLSTIINQTNMGLGMIYKLFLFDDLNTHNNLKYMQPKNAKIIILHSKNDEIIPYEEAKKNYNRCKELKLDVKLIEITGTHNNPIFSNNIL